MALFMVSRRASTSPTLLARVLGGSLRSSASASRFSTCSINFDSDVDEADGGKCTVFADGGQSMRSDEFTIKRGFCDPYLQNPFQTSGPQGAYEVKPVEEGVFVRMEMPGIDKEDVKIWVDDNDTVFVKGEGKVDSNYDESSRAYSAKIQVPTDDLEIDEMEAEIKNGVLRMLIPKPKPPPVKVNDGKLEVKLK